MQRAISYESLTAETEAHAELAQIGTIQADDGQKFGLIHANQRASGYPPIVSLSGFLNSDEGAKMRYETGQIAAANPNHQVAKIIMPGHGSSDPLTKDQHDEIREQGTIELTATAIAQGLRNKFARSSGAIFEGKSLGARMMPDTARALGGLGMAPLLAVGTETVGMVRRRSLGMTLSFFGSEWWRNRSQYENNDDMQPLMADYATFETAVSEKGLVKPISDGAVLQNILRKDWRMAAFMIAGSPLAKNTAPQAIEQCLTKHPDAPYRLVFGGRSTICRWKDIEPVVTDLESRLPSLSHTILPDDTHGLGMESQAPRTAVYLRDQIAALNL